MNGFDVPSFVVSTEHGNRLSLVCVVWAGFSSFLVSLLGLDNVLSSFFKNIRVDHLTEALIPDVINGREPDCGGS